MKKKFVQLFHNFGLLFVSNFSSKILVFLLVPFYTSILTTEDYGIYDLVYSTIQLITPIFTLNIMESVFRFAMDQDKDLSQIFSIGIKYVFFSFFLVFFSLTFMKYFVSISFLQTYFFYILMFYFFYILHDTVIQFSRGLNLVKSISIAGVLETIAMICFNLFFLLFMKWQLRGYFCAMILSFFVPTLYLVIQNKLWKFVRINHQFFSFSPCEKQMVLYSLPLIFISLSWYVNNVADRLAVSSLCGIEANGVYSISYKIPTILNALQTVFIQAWQISAIKEFQANNKTAFYSFTYTGCQIVMVTCCSMLIAFTQILARFLFANEFYAAWIYVPILLIYIVFNALSGTVGAIFSAAKDTRKLAWSGIIGALVNILLNYILILKIGVMGAAIATLVSSIVIWLLRIISTKRYVSLKINVFLHVVQYVLLIIQACCMILLKSQVYSYVIQLLIFLILGIISIVEFKEMKKYVV